MKRNILTVVLVFNFVLSFSQKEDWIKLFAPTLPNIYTTSRDLIETYDKGYLITSVQTNPSSTVYKWGWLIKTDINGNILWEKKIGDGEQMLSFTEMVQSPDGGYLLSGTTDLMEGSYGDAFFMKLNACGEKEWCRVIHNNNNDNPYDYGAALYPIPDEDAYVGLVANWGVIGPGDSIQGVWLLKLNNNGNPIWIKNIFDQVHPLAWNEMPYEMFISSSGELIISGFILYGVPTGFIKPFIASANFDGTENWWSIVGNDEEYAGISHFAYEHELGYIYSTGWLADYNFPDIRHPGIHKLDIYGNQIYSKLIIDSTELAQTYCLNFVNDTIIDIAGVWNYPGQSFYNSIARIDTAGSLIFEKQILQSDYGFSNSINTFDNKSLYVGPIENGIFTNIHLHKFNSDLEYDTIYNQPYEYDYMCDDLPIVSDTIGIDDCLIWTDLPDEIKFNQLQNLVIYPNPATEKINIKLPWATVVEQPFGPFNSRHYNLQYFENSVLRIYNVNGVQVKEISLKNQQENELEINVSNFPKGMYLINLYDFSTNKSGSNKEVASGKFIVQ